MNNLQMLRSKYKSVIFNDLEVFETGDAFRIKTGRYAVLKQTGGYEKVNVRINGKMTSRSISRLVYELFIDNNFNSKDNKYYIDTNGKCAGEYMLTEIRKVRSLGTHKRVFTTNENWGRKGEN